MRTCPWIMQLVPGAGHAKHSASVFLSVWPATSSYPSINVAGRAPTNTPASKSNLDAVSAD